MNEAEVVSVSSVSILEIRIKTMLGKLESPASLLESITSAGLKFLPFNEIHAETIADFPDLSRHDPFDRMLLAQANAERMNLLTSDETLLRLNMSYVLSAKE